MFSSLAQALLHACISCSLKPQIEWIAASDLEDESEKSVYTTPLMSFILLESFGSRGFICLYYHRFPSKHHFSPLQTPEAHAAAWKILKVKLFFVTCLVKGDILCC